MKFDPRGTIASGVLAALGLAGNAVAQEATRPAANDDGKLEEVVVTGTSIRGAAPVGSNLITVGRDEIEASGAQTISQVLRSVPAVTGFGTGGQGGGGRPDMAQGGGPDGSKAKDAIDAVKEALEKVAA